MIFENVNFNEEEVRKLSAEEFEEMHIGLFWLDRDEQIRKKMLSQVYKLITRPAKEKTKPESGE